MEPETPRPCSNVQPVWRFGLLCLSTFGLYELFWFYRGWKWLKTKDGLGVWPFWRAFFAPLFAYSFFKRISTQARERGAAPMPRPGGCAALYLLLFLGWRLPEPYSLISLLSFLPLIPAVRTLNAYWEKEQPQQPVKDHFSSLERFLVALGIAVVLLAVIGSLAPKAPAP